MQNIFLKIDRKILITLAVVLIVVLIAGFLVYKYSKDVGRTVQNNNGEAIMEDLDERSVTPETILPVQNTEIQPQPGLTICADECGNGICQPSDPQCDDKLNCICAETKADCPDDCK